MSIIRVSKAWEIYEKCEGFENNESD